MRTKIIMLLVVCSLFTGKVNAQWVVSDPGNSGARDYQCVKEHRSNVLHSPNNDKELSGNRKDLPTG